jgi:hypothetical protein
MSPYLLTTLVVLADEAPADEDVVAGPIGFVIFIGLVIAVALLGWSLNKHLKKAHRAADAGVYGDPEEPTDADTIEPVGSSEPIEPSEPSEPGKASGEK